MQMPFRAEQLMGYDPTTYSFDYCRSNQLSYSYVSIKSRALDNLVIIKEPLKYTVNCKFCQVLFFICKKKTFFLH